MTFTPDFINEKNKVQNIPISLVIIEVSKAFIGECESGSTVNSIKISSALSAAIDAYLDGLDETWSSTVAYGGWIISFERGKNVGSRRVITNLSGTTVTLNTALDSVPYTSTTVKDKIRIAKCLYLASWNMPVDFFLPDNSSDAGQEITFTPFPMQVEPVGANITGEVVNVSMAVANVNRLIGGFIQKSDGLRGNRVIRMIVFDGVLDNKYNCKKDVMYIDRVTVTTKEVTVTLESKFNIMGVDLPLGSYNRDFCSWRFKSAQCGFGYNIVGYPSPLGTLDSTNFPLASATSCDHTLKGANGCAAHTNTIRFGGFPGIPAVK